MMSSSKRSWMSSTARSRKTPMPRRRTPQLLNR